MITDPGALTVDYILTFLTTYFFNAAIVLLIFFSVGALIVTVRKWMKSRKSGGEKKLDAEMERIRAEIASRSGQGQ